MKLLKTIAAVSAIAVSSFSVNAEVLNIGGITWDTSYADGTVSTTDFFSYAEFVQTRDEDIVSAVGVVNTINGQSRSEYCPAGDCKLTFTFSDFLVTETAGVETVSGGKLDFYVTTYDDAALTNAVSSELWLSLLSDSAATYSNSISQAFVGLYSVVENVGQVDYNFDTNTMANGSDLVFRGASFDGTGSGSFNGKSVPAPTTLAIFGLGLLGLARLRKAK